MDRCVKELPDHEAAQRRIHHFIRMLNSAELNTYTQSMLHDFIDQIQIELSEVHTVLMDQYFLSGRMHMQVQQQEAS